MSLSFRALRTVARPVSLHAAALKQSVAHGHSLVTPPDHSHMALSSFENGVPTSQVRELSPQEKKWDFWTSSDAFGGAKPESGLKAVPYGQAWVIERGSSSRVVAEGSTLILPLMDKVKAVKNIHPVAMGIVTPAVTLKDGSSVNGYAVVYVQVTDFLKSTYYVDPETNRSDSERAAAKLIRRTLELELPSFTAKTFGEAEKSQLESKLKAVIAEKSAEYGLEVTSVEFRGVFDANSNVPDKLRALDPPTRPDDAPGHGLKADYWADVLSPPYFEAKKFGNSREPRTPATVTLEWVCPSPPDYHHFNELPRMTANAPPNKAVKSAH